MPLQFFTRRPKPKTGLVEPLKDAAKAAAPPAEKPKELGGPSGPEPTRYGDWERKGICVDF